MPIADIKKKELNLSSLITLSLQVWLRIFIPYLKIIGLMLLFILAAIILFLLLLRYVPIALLMMLFLFSFPVLLFVLNLLFITFIPIADDIICGIKPSVFNALESISVKSFLKLIAAVIIIVLAFTVLRLPLFLTDNPLLMMPYLLLLFIVSMTAMVYIMFFPQAIFLRDAGILQCFTYSYYLVKDRWWQTFGRILMFALIQMVIMGALIGILAAIFFIVNGFNIAALVEVYKVSPQMFLMALFPLFKSIAIFAVLGYVLIGFTAVYQIVANTVLFNNLELDETEKKDAAEEDLIIGGTPLDTGKDPEFTEMFNNVKEVNIPTASDTEKFANPQQSRTREEVLRNFEPIEIHDDTPDAPKAEPQKIVQRIDEYPTAPIGAIKKDLKLQPQEDGKMPTLDITTRIKNNNHGLPSIYKPEGGE